ncbi:class I SAM-dependent methyltransferase [Hydrogenophaga sp.]|uniref:class I SAM-dependent methyltransferase n=1 Tax=Hydrogenophaga sp. TaxID=1904254 RepID=UPI0027285985|nr:class I SAM-dependent methyltransferase [Hydrogenophaga sp.]MDO9436512.1 class I SAM-dependent methyltransferase [Hydrogenophaga sp.]
MKNSDASGPSQEQVAKDFDDVATSYSNDLDKTLAFTGMEHAFFVDVKRDHIVRMAQAHFPDLTQLDVLDLGCGIGAYHAGLKNRFRELHGIDVSEHSIQLASAKHPFVRYATFDGVRLPYEDQQFSLTFAVCVMHHVPPAQWASLLRELNRVTRPNGLMLIFEHNPYNPATQYIVKTCDIDKDAVLLRPRTLKKLAQAAGFEALDTKTIISVPPASPVLKRLDSLLGHLPFGAQYYLRGVKASA